MINFHNKIQQSLLLNLKDNASKTQFPLSGINANHPQAGHESAMLSSNDDDENTDRHCEIINNFNAQIYDENESKYLHVIDYDMQDPVSVIGNFQQAKNGHQSLKDMGTNTSDTLSDVGNDFVVRIKETNLNLRQDSNLDKQLADNPNPRRLHEKQTKPHKNTPKNNNIMEVEIRHCNFEENIQPRSKVKNLIHDYELQVQEQSNHRKSGKKHGDQFDSILDTNGVESSYTNNGSTKNNTNHIPTVDSEEPLLNGSYSFHEQENESQEIVTKSDSKVNNTHRSMTKQNNTSDILDSNARKQFLGARSLQSSPSDKNLKRVTQVINTDVDCSITKDTTTSLAGSNQEKQSTNVGDTNYYHSLKFGNDYQNFIDDYDQFSLSSTREMRSSYPVEAFSGGSKVTRAHWYDIHSSSEKSSQGIKPLILEQGNALKTKATEVNTHETSSQMLGYDLATGNSFHQRRWKSLGELDRVDQVEEYKLPDKLNKTTYPVANDEDTTHGVNNLDTMLLSSIPRNRDFNSLPRYGTNQHGQKLHSNRTERFSPHAKTVPQSHSQSNRNYAQNTKNSQMVSLGIENKNSWQHNARGAQQTPPPARNKYLGNKSNYRENRAHMYNINNTEKIIPGCKTDDISTSKHSPLLAKKHGKIMTQPVNKYSDSSKISNDNFTSASERWNYSPIKRSSSPTRKHEKLSGRFQKVNKSSEHLNHLRDDNNNLSRSLTHLETLDQSPMKRSPKIKNLVDIEYYDIASDEELNSKITRRPRTKSLNDENKTMEYVVPRREIKSSGDLRTVGVTQQEIAVENKDEETARRIDSSSGGLLRTHGKYTDLYADSVSYNKHSVGKIQSYDTTYPSLGPKTNPSIEVNSLNKNVNRYERHSQGPQISNTDSTMNHALSNNGNEHYSIQSQHGRSHFGSSKSVEHMTQKDNHVRSTNKTNLTNNLKQNQSRIKRSKSPLHNSKGNTANINYTAKHQKEKSDVTTVKRFPNPLQNRFESKIDSPGKQAKNTRDPASKSIVYPVEDYRLTQGKYNIAKAEEWRKRYGKLPYNNKDPLHQSSDKEFGRLFQHSERNSGNRNSSKENDLAKQHFSLGSIGDTSSSSVFGTNSIDNDDASIMNSHSKDFSTTLNKLSSYLLSGYKDELTQNSPLHAQEETKSETTVKFRRFYLDDEGDLSHVLDDSKESPKLSMLVHAIIRLREVYSVQPYAKPQTPDHPTNLGNPQLCNAIQNKPMSVVKDLILANKNVDINIRSQSGDSALHRAAAEGDLDAIRIMINQGANVNIRDRNGFQPVHQALRCHNYKAAMFLMDCGTDLMSYTSKRIQEFVNVKAIAKQYLRQTLKTPL